MSTDHRGRPLASQGGAIPHRNRQFMTYGPNADEMGRDEQLDYMRDMMEDRPAEGNLNPFTGKYNWND